MSDADTVVVPGGTEALRFQRVRLRGAAGEGPSFDLPVIHIGAAPDNDLVLDNPTASRAHARLTFTEDGWRLRDLGSKNGTFVQGVRIFEALVPVGARVRFGTEERIFERADQAVEVELSRGDRFGRLLGKSTLMRQVFALLGRVAPATATVLVQGESGTGKELAAEAIHDHSPRRDRDLVVFDCSAVAPELIESELFGHVRGAFTGAAGARAGVFAEADGSTLFLDEIGELPLDLQPKLLRALEAGTYRPVGADRPRTSDVRVVAATNRRLEDAVAEGSFREDLYYRLAVVKVRMPPLRQRPEDIPLLVSHFLAQAGAQGMEVGFETMQRLQAHPWPGNVRELRNYVERAVLLSDQGRLETRHLGTERRGADAGEADAEGQALLRVDLDRAFKDAKGALVEAFERRYWGRLLEQTGGNVSEAARRGGLHRKSLEYLLKKYDLRGGEGTH